MRWGLVLLPVATALCKVLTLADIEVTQCYKTQWPPATDLQQHKHGPQQLAQWVAAPGPFVCHSESCAQCVVPHDMPDPEPGWGNWHAAAPPRW